MKAYQVVQWGQPPEYQDVPVPEPGPGQVLVKVGGAGLCHSDLGIIHLDETMIQWKPPFTLGHEVAGWVETVGSGVTGVEVGEGVAVTLGYGCGACARCRANTENLCERAGELPYSGFGMGLDGGMAPFLLVDSIRRLVPLGSMNPVLAAPLTDAGVTPYRAIRRSLDRLGPGSRAVVIGVGGLGHLAVQILTAVSPAVVIAIDNRPEALTLAASCGATHTVVAGESAAGEVLELTGGLGADVVLDFVGNDETLPLALGSARTGGKVVVVGIGGSVPWNFWAAKSEVELTNSLGGSADDLRSVLALAADGHVKAEVTTFPFDEIPQAFAALESGALEGRAVILPNGLT